VIVIPRPALREGGEVLLVDEEGILRRRLVSVLWSDADQVVVDDSLSEGEILAVTSLSVSASGSPVVATVDGEVLNAGSNPGEGSTPRAAPAVTN